MKTKIYIAGRVTGDPLAKKKFKEAEDAFSKDHFVVLSPAFLPYGMTEHDYMRICLSIIDVVDVVVFLDDWKESEGAKVEHAYCKKIGKEILYLGNGTGAK